MELHDLADPTTTTVKQLFCVRSLGLSSGRRLIGASFERGCSPCHAAAAMSCGVGSPGMVIAACRSKPEFAARSLAVAGTNQIGLEARRKIHLAARSRSTARSIRHAQVLGSRAGHHACRTSLRAFSFNRPLTPAAASHARPCPPVAIRCRRRSVRRVRLRSRCSALWRRSCRWRARAGAR